MNKQTFEHSPLSPFSGALRELGQGVKALITSAPSSSPRTHVKVGGENLLHEA